MSSDNTVAVLILAGSCLLVLLVGGRMERQHLRRFEARRGAWAISGAWLIGVTLLPVVALWGPGPLLVALLTAVAAFILVPYDRRPPRDLWMSRRCRVRRIVLGLWTLLSDDVSLAERHRIAAARIEELQRLEEPATEDVVDRARRLLSAWAEDAAISPEEIRAWWIDLHGALALVFADAPEDLSR